MNVRMGTPRPMTGIRQQVAVDLMPRVTNKMAPVLAALVSSALALVLLTGLWAGHKVDGIDRQISALEQQQVLLAAEQQTLNKIHDQLTSKAYVLAVAGARFDLHSPGKGQVHRWR